LSKAKVQVYLASKETVNISLGIAAQKKYWPFNNNKYDLIKLYLNMLASINCNVYWNLFTI